MNREGVAGAGAVSEGGVQLRGWDGVEGGRRRGQAFAGVALRVLPAPPHSTHSLLPPLLPGARAR